MKPLGIYFQVSGTSGQRTGLDDDYDWHLRQAATAHAAAASSRPARPTRLAFLPERVRGIGRLLHLPSGEPTARRA